MGWLRGGEYICIIQESLKQSKSRKDRKKLRSFQAHRGEESFLQMSVYRRPHGQSGGAVAGGVNQDMTYAKHRLGQCSFPRVFTTHHPGHPSHHFLGPGGLRCSIIRLSAERSRKAFVEQRTFRLHWRHYILPAIFFFFTNLLMLLYCIRGICLWISSWTISSLRSNLLSLQIPHPGYCLPHADTQETHIDLKSITGNLVIIRKW